MSYSTIYQLNSTGKELIEQLGWNILSQINHPNDKQIELYLNQLVYIRKNLLEKFKENRYQDKQIEEIKILENNICKIIKFIEFFKKMFQYDDFINIKKDCDNQFLNKTNKNAAGGKPKNNSQQTKSQINETQINSNRQTVSQKQNAANSKPNNQQQAQSQINKTEITSNGQTVSQNKNAAGGKPKNNLQQAQQQITKTNLESETAGQPTNIPINYIPNSSINQGTISTSNQERNAPIKNKQRPSLLKSITNRRKNYNNK